MYICMHSSSKKLLGPIHPDWNKEWHERRSTRVSARPSKCIDETRSERACLLCGCLDGGEEIHKPFAYASRTFLWFRVQDPNHVNYARQSARASTWSKSSIINLWMPRWRYKRQFSVSPCTYNLHEHPWLIFLKVWFGFLESVHDPDLDRPNWINS